MGDVDRSHTTSRSPSPDAASEAANLVAHVARVEVEQRRLDADDQRRRARSRCPDGAPRSEKRRVPGMRPRNATCGSAARRISSSIDTIAASSTPFRMPSSSTPANATIAIRNSSRLTCHDARSSRDVDQPLDRDEHDGREHDVGRLRSRPVRNSRHSADGDRREDERQRRARAGLVVDGRLRQSAGDRVALAERRGEVGRAEREQFLARVDLVAVLLRERARRRHALDVGEQEARERERDHAVHVAQPQRRQAQIGQPGRQLADGLDAALARAA